MIGYRKFALATLGLVLSFILAVRGQLTSDFAWVVSVAVGGYHAANAFVNRQKETP